MRRLHVLGLPLTVVSEEYGHCAATGKVLRFARMMRPLGYTVVEYSNGSSESGADVHVQILSASELADSADALGALFASRLLRAVTALAAPGELVCHVSGPDASVMAALPECIHVESAVGYARVESPCPYRIYESSAWMHWHYGRRHLEFGRNYEFVAPSYYDCGDWDVVETPPETPTVLFLGLESSGVETVLAAARALPGVRFVLCGHDPNFSISEPNVAYAPPVFGRARSALLGAATALLAPSMLIGPACGSAVEAQLCGTPVICSRYGALTETVEDGLTGYVCHTLADYVVAVTRAVLVDRRYVAWRARRLYSLEAVGQRYDEILSDIADLRGAGWYSRESHKFGTDAPVVRRIPKVRFCTGAGRGGTLEAQQALSPDHEVRYFDRTERDAFVVVHFPQFLEHYRNLLPGAYQADLWRLMVLYVHGGVYADLDERLAEPLSTVVRPTDELVMCIDPASPAWICNALIAASPRSPALLFAIERIVRTRLEPRDKGECAHDVAGPQALGSAVRCFFGGAALVAGDYGTHRLLAYERGSEAQEHDAWRTDRVFRDVAAAQRGLSAAYLPLRRWKGLFSTLLEWAECQLENGSVEIECVDWPKWLTALLPHAPARACPSESAVDARHVPAMVPDALMRRPGVLAGDAALLAPLHALVSPGAPLSPAYYVRAVARAWFERERGGASFVVGVHGRAAVHFDTATLGLEDHTRALCEEAREELASSGRPDARVLLASCNTSIVRQVRASLGDVVAWREPEGALNEGDVDWGLERQELTREIAAGALIDALLLSMCDVVVCGSSNVMLYAAALRPAMRVRVARHLVSVRGL
jgi:hypothetical protein